MSNPKNARVEGEPVLIESVARHRNGVCGEPFDVVTFLWDKRQMVGVVFGADRNDFNPMVAVFDRTLLGQGNITFSENSWRGDYFADVLKCAIAAHRAPGAEMTQHAKRSSQ